MYNNNLTKVSNLFSDISSEYDSVTETSNSLTTRVYNSLTKITENVTAVRNKVAVLGDMLTDLRVLNGSAKNVINLTTLDVVETQGLQIKDNKFELSYLTNELKEIDSSLSSISSTVPYRLFNKENKEAFLKDLLKTKSEVLLKFPNDNYTFDLNLRYRSHEQINTIVLQLDLLTESYPDILSIKYVSVDNSIKDIILLDTNSRNFSLNENRVKDNRYVFNITPVVTDQIIIQFSSRESSSLSLKSIETYYSNVIESGYIVLGPVSTEQPILKLAFDSSKITEGVSVEVSTDKEFWIPLSNSSSMDLSNTRKILSINTINSNSIKNDVDIYSVYIKIIIESSILSNEDLDVSIYNTLREDNVIGNDLLNSIEDIRLSAYRVSSSDLVHGKYMYNSSVNLATLPLDKIEYIENNGVFKVLGLTDTKYSITTTNNQVNVLGSIGAELKLKRMIANGTLDADTYDVANCKLYDIYPRLINETINTKQKDNLAILLKKKKVAEVIPEIPIIEPPIEPPIDTLFLFHVPTKSPDGYAPNIQPFISISINGVSYSLEGISEMNTSNVRSPEIQGFTFPPEVAEVVRIHGIQTNGPASTPYYANYGDQKVFFRNKTTESLNIELVLNTDPSHELLIDYYDSIVSDNRNASFKKEDYGFSFTLSPRNETAEDWLELLVNIESIDGPLLEQLYFEIITGDGYSGGEMFTEDDYMEIDWGDGSPILKYVFSEHMNSEDYDKSSTYFYEPYSYAAPGQYTVRLRTTFPLEYFFAQNVVEVKQWGNYISNGIYGLGGTWSGGNTSHLRTFPSKVPPSIDWFDFGQLAQDTLFDVEMIDPNYTVLESRDVDYGEQFWNVSEPEILRNNAHFVFGSELSSYNLNKLPTVDYIVYEVSGAPGGGEGLVTMMEFRGPEVGLDFQGPTKPVSEGGTIRWRHDETSNKTTYLIDLTGWGSPTDLSFFLYAGWSTVGTGNLNVNIKGYTGGVDFGVGDALTFESATNVYDRNYVYNSNYKLIGTEVPLEVANIALDPYVNALIPHNSIYSRKVGIYTRALTGINVDSEVVETYYGEPDRIIISGFPYDYINIDETTGAHELPISNRGIIQLNESGEGSYVEERFFIANVPASYNYRLQPLFSNEVDYSWSTLTSPVGVEGAVYFDFATQKTTVAVNISPGGGIPGIYRVVTAGGDYASDTFEGGTTGIDLYPGMVNQGDTVYIDVVYTSNVGHTYSYRKLAN